MDICLLNSKSKCLGILIFLFAFLSSCKYMPYDIEKIIANKQVIVNEIDKQSLNIIGRGQKGILYFNYIDSSQCNFLINDDESLSFTFAEKNDSLKCFQRISLLKSFLDFYNIREFVYNHYKLGDIILYLKSGYVVVHIKDVSKLDIQMKELVLPSYRKINDNWYYAKSVFY